MVKSVLIYGIGGMLNRLVGLLLLPLLTRYLTPRDYGMLSMLQLVVLFLVPVFSLGLTAALAPVYFARTEPSARRAVANTTTWILAGSATLLFLLAWLTSPWSAPALLGEHGQAVYVMIFAASTACSMVTGPLLLVLQFEERAGAFVAFSAGGAILTALLNIWTVAIMGWGFQGWILSTLAANAIQLVCCLVQFYAPGRPLFDYAVARALLRQGLPLIPAFFFLWLMQQGNRWCLEATHGMAALGIFSFGANLGTVVSLVTGAFQTAWLPFFMRYAQNPSAGRDIFARMTTLYVLGGGMLVLCLFAFSREVVTLIAAPAFHSAAAVVGWTGLSQVLLTGTSLLMPPQYFAHKVHHQSYVQGIASVLSLVPAWIFSFLWGVNGTAWAMAGAYSLLIMAYLIFNHVQRKSYGLQLKFEGFEMLLITGFNAALAAVVWALPGDGIKGWGFAFLACAAGLAFTWWRLRPAERSKIFSLMRMAFLRTRSTIPT
jgi:O-antigen/teichoic acid export membrane protein